MITEKNKRFKFLSKNLIILRNNPLYWKKVLRFKKKKWINFLTFFKKQIKWPKKYKIRDITKYLVPRFPDKFSAYKKRYKQTLVASQMWRLFYGVLTWKSLKNKLIKHHHHIKNYWIELLKMFEQQLDVVLYWAKFCYSMANARQFIKHKKVRVNGIVRTYKSFHCASLWILKGWFFQKPDLV